MIQLEADRIRFSGYQLCLLTLDETGPSYAWAPPHPQLVRPEPMQWSMTGMYSAEPLDPYFMPNVLYPVIP